MHSVYWCQKFQNSAKKKTHTHILIAHTYVKNEKNINNIWSLGSICMLVCTSTTSISKDHYFDEKLLKEYVCSIVLYFVCR